MDRPFRSLVVLVPVLLIGGCRDSLRSPAVTIQALSCSRVGDQIAFVASEHGWRTGEAWLVAGRKASSEATRVLTGTKSGIWALGWRHDGKGLAVEGGPPQTDGLWLVSTAAPGEPTPLARGEDLDSPDWSPDDKWLVWADSHSASGTRLAVMRMADKAVHYLTTAVDPEFPQWSPTGQWISFYGLRRHPQQQTANGVYIVSADGGKERRVNCHRTTHFVWMGPEELLCFSGTRKTNGTPEFQVWKTNVRSDERVSLLATTRLPEHVWAGQTPPAISPDGHQLLVMAGTQVEAGNIYRINLSEGGVHQLTTGEADSCPCWFADGQTIAFVRAQMSIWTMRPDGSHQRRLLDVRDLGR